MKLSFDKLPKEIQTIINTETNTMSECGLGTEDEDYRDEFTVHRLTNTTYEVSTSGQGGENIPSGSLHVLTVEVCIPADEDEDFQYVIRTGTDYSLWDQTL